MGIAFTAVMANGQSVEGIPMPFCLKLSREGRAALTVRCKGLAVFSATSHEGQRVALQGDECRIGDLRWLRACPWRDSGERVGQLIMNQSLPKQLIGTRKHT